MKKYIILAVIIIVLSCKGNKSECCPPNPLQETTEVVQSSAELDTAFENITRSLHKSTNVENSIKVILEKGHMLVKSNHELKQELKSTKDSLVKTKFQLVETLKKVPKKRNLVQRMLGIARDSVEVIQIDTIQN